MLDNNHKIIVTNLPHGIVTLCSIV